MTISVALKKSHQPSIFYKLRFMDAVAQTKFLKIINEIRILLAGKPLSGRGGGGLVASVVGL